MASITENRAWDSCFVDIKNQIDDFNSKALCQITPDELNHLDEKISDEFKRLKSIVEELEHRKKMSFFGLSKKKVVALITGRALGTLLGTGALIYTALDVEPISKWVVMALGIATVWIGDTIDGCETIIFFSEDRKASLKINTFQAIQQVRTFKKFIKLFKEIKLQNQQNEANQHTIKNKIEVDEDLSDEMEITTGKQLDLDAQIQKCLKKYEKLNPVLKKESAYSEVLSSLIQELPEKDPLKKELNELQETAKIVDEMEIPTAYINPSVDTESPIEWEQGEKRNYKGLHNISLESFDQSLHLNPSWVKERWAELKQQIKNRFEINKEIEYLKVKGIRFHSNGFENMSKSNETNQADVPQSVYYTSTLQVNPVEAYGTQPETITEESPV